VTALSLGVAETTSEIRKALKAADEPWGLIVTQLRPVGPGAVAGLTVGDLLTHLGINPLIHAADILAVAKPTPQNPVLVRVVRSGTARFVAITGEERAP